MNEAALDVVAANVRSARAAAGLSLDALAGRADVSKGALVALEGARGNPNLTTLVRLADALGRPVSSLMEDGREEPVVVVEAAEVAPLWTGPSGGTARLLLTNPRPAPVEVWRWLLHPDERHDSHAHPAGVTETLTVMRGQMRLVVGDSVRPLRAGATTVFAADVPHAYEGAGRGPCELIMTVHLPMEHLGADRA
jgi:transcriptional regulator with XRE-family HTH domain